MPNLKNKLLGSSAWLTSEYFVDQALRLVANVVLARILFPEAFGIMALVQVFLQGMEMLSDVGIRGAIIKSNQREDHQFLDTAWTIQVCRGIVLFLLVLPLAPFYAQALQEPQLTYLIIASGAINFVNSIKPTKGITAGIAMKHRLLVLIRVFSSTFATIVTVVAALITENIWSFILGNLAGTLLRTLLLFVAVPGRCNRFRMNTEAFKDIIGFSLWVFISSAVTFGVNQADKIIIGSTLGTKALGLYNVAFFIASAPKLLFESINSRIGQPLFSPKSKTPIEKIKKFQMISVAGSCLALTVLSLLGPAIIHFLYDSRYDVSAAIVPFIALSFTPTILAGSYVILLLANGRSKLTTYYMLVKLSLQLPLLYILITHYNLFGMILAAPIVELLCYPLLVKFAKQTVHVNFKFDLLLLSCWAVICAFVLKINTHNIATLLNFS